MKVDVDQYTCIGCGLCPSICPEVFELRDEGKAYTRAQTISEELEDPVKDAASSCPVSAIAVND